MWRFGVEHLTSSRYVEVFICDALTAYRSFGKEDSDMSEAKFSSVQTSVI